MCLSLAGRRHTNAGGRRGHHRWSPRGSDTPRSMKKSSMSRRYTMSFSGRPLPLRPGNSRDSSPARAKAGSLFVSSRKEKARRNSRGEALMVAKCAGTIRLNFHAATWGVGREWERGAQRGLSGREREGVGSTAMAKASSLRLGATTTRPVGLHPRTRRSFRRGA
jgi:hypothetical protein